MQKNFPVVRHLDDIDDLRSFWRDWWLIPWQDSKAKEIADTFIDEIEVDNIKTLLMITSPRKRARETAELVYKEIKNRNKKVNIRIIEEDSFREIDQWNFILPEWYKSWDKYEWLILAWKIFFQEVFGADYGWKDNYNYKYWDSFIKNNIIKYPELNNFFLEPWESYKDVLIRIYTQIIKASQSRVNHHDDIKISVFTHWQPSQIIKDLVEVSSLIKNENFSFKVWELPRICRNRYKQRGEKKRNLGKVDFIPIDWLFDSQLINRLQLEVDFLENL